MHLYKHLKSVALMAASMLASNLAVAQTWSVSEKTLNMAMGCIVYIETEQSIPNATTSVKDTLTGTAFLISQGKKVYLVTTKHTVIDAISQQVSNSIFISATWKSDDKGIKITGLANWNKETQPFVFSSNDDDIAIISFQKNNYKSVLSALLRQDCVPIPVKLLDASIHYPGNSFFLPHYSTFKNQIGEKIKQKGINPGKIKTFKAISSSFSINHSISYSNNGAPVILNNKIIGMLIKGDGPVTYNGAPWTFGTATKASAILSLLKKLQQTENTPGFN